MSLEEATSYYGSMPSHTLTGARKGGCGNDGSNKVVHGTTKHTATITLHHVCHMHPPPLHNESYHACTHQMHASRRKEER